MAIQRFVRGAILAGLAFGLTACGDGTDKAAPTREMRDDASGGGGMKLWDLFNRSADPNVTVQVNKYLWAASLDVLNFLPIESVDPFTGVIVTGYGTPPGGGRAYRATIYVQDPALDARSLKVSLQTSGGGSAAPETVKAVEDAILTRARQLRVRDGNL
ncbi:MAG: DUF3576 domain-containing protein [Paracoccaceae bacterium]